jgi:HlyD family secretion protein
MRRKAGILIILILLITVVCGGVWWLRTRRGSNTVFRTTQVKRGDLLASISATGTVEPTVVVIVGAQVNGLIKSFGKDKYGKTVDYASVVEQGTVLANIDDSLYVATRDAAKAQLEQAVANKAGADANVLQMKANLLLTQQNWDRAQKLGPSEALAQSAYDQYRAGFEAAKANLAASEAAVLQAKASIAQNRAALNTAELNLGYCTIKAPVKGVIIDRQVNIGQTVVSSLSAPSLFLLATDLKRITVWISVNEADVGSIYPGQPVTFTVDAFPNREFKGVVGKVRLNATMTQNVVTYTVEVNTNNDDGKLLPYLTANAKFITGRRENVLLVPNAALRWVPQPDLIVPEARKKRHGADGAKREKEGGAESAGPTQTHGNLWVQQGNLVRPIHVNVGLTDGAFTEVMGKEVTEGMAVVTGEFAKEDKAGTAAERSPLMPQQPFARGQQRGGQARPGGPDNPDASRERNGAPK